MTTENGTVIRGVVRFPPGAGGSLARIRVSLRDVAESDAPARTVAEVDLPAISVPPGGGDVSFTLPSPVSRAGSHTLALRAHADRSGDGEVGPGDLVTTTTVGWSGTGDEPVVLEVRPI